MLAEVAQTVDDLVIISGGELIVQAPMAEVLARSAGGTRVRSPDATRLAALLEAQQLKVERLGDDVLVVDSGPERVGELAAANGIVLHALTTERATLEEVFLELTGDPGDRGA